MTTYQKFICAAFMALMAAAFYLMVSTGDFLLPLLLIVLPASGLLPYAREKGLITGYLLDKILLVLAVVIMIMLWLG